MNGLAPVTAALSGRLTLLALLLAPVALFVACQDDASGPAERPGPSLHVVVSASSLIDPGECVDLLAEETVVVGEVCVINDVENLQVQFRAGGDHRFTETQVEVTLLSLDDDDEDGRFRKGQEFELETEHEPPVASFTLSISSEQLAVVPGNPVLIEVEVDLAVLYDEAEGGEELEDASAEFAYTVGDGILVAQFVGPEGATVSTSDGRVRLEIEAGSVSEQVIIAITEGSRSGTGAEGVVPGTLWELQPEGVRFDPPAVLSVEFDPSLLPDGIADPDNSLTLATLIEGLWHEIPRFIEAPPNTVSGPIAGFSLKAIVERALGIEPGLPGSITLPPGEQFQLDPTPTGERGVGLLNRALDFSSSQQSVVTVDPLGVVTALAPGEATVAVTASVVLPLPGFSMPVPIEVCGEIVLIDPRLLPFIGLYCPGFFVQVPVALVLVTPDVATIAVGEMRLLTATLFDDQGNILSNRVVAWSTDDATVATVDQTGLVTAQAPGLATVTAESESQMATAAITVPQPPMGPTDTDGDGVADLNDACINDPGDLEFMGCLNIQDALIGTWVGGLNVFEPPIQCGNFTWVIHSVTLADGKYTVGGNVSQPDVQNDCNNLLPPMAVVTQPPLDRGMTLNQSVAMSPLSYDRGNVGFIFQGDQPCGVPLIPSAIQFALSTVSGRCLRNNKDLFTFQLRKQQQ